MSLEENQKLESLPSKRSTKLRKVGIGLVILSFIFYGGLLLIPLTYFSTGMKWTISSVLVILGEITFWIGGFILGKEVVARYKRYFNPLNWFGNNKKS
jgi:hypothetical protein